jgi:hypothetical protein
MQMHHPMELQLPAFLGRLKFGKRNPQPLALPPMVPINRPPTINRASTTGSTASSRHPTESEIVGCFGYHDNLEYWK